MTHGFPASAVFLRRESEAEEIAVIERFGVACKRREEHLIAPKSYVAQAKRVRVGGWLRVFPWAEEKKESKPHHVPGCKRNVIARCRGDLRGPM